MFRPHFTIIGLLYKNKCRSVNMNVHFLQRAHNYMCFFLQICLHPQGICKITETKMLTSPLKNVRHPTAPTCCFCFPFVVGNNSFSKMYVHARCFVQFCREHCVIKVFISGPDRGTIYAFAYVVYIYIYICIYVHILYIYIYVRV